MNKVPKFHVVGGGLAGCEATWQLLRVGFDVTLHEMRPNTTTGAHQTGDLAELVCSNSMKSEDPSSAPGLLKHDMTAFGSLILAAAQKARVPAGQALAVDRQLFSKAVQQALESKPRFNRSHNEITELPTPDEMASRNEYWIVATGPLTSQRLAANLSDYCPEGSRRLHFYDAIAPILDGDSIDSDHAFRANRYDQNETDMGAGDYLNLPLNRPQYEAFITAVRDAEYMPLHDFEDTKYFEGCLPIEVMVARGPDTLRFGPMKPVGLTDPKTGSRPYAAVQLRQENQDATMFSMVGFQTKMKWPEQKRVFSMIPALRGADFLRFGSVHRNTYLESPKVLNADLSFRLAPRLFLAGQITGVEGYVESAAIGVLAGRAAFAKARQAVFVPPPRDTMIGALLHYVTVGVAGEFQPMNSNFGLLPALPKRRGEGRGDRRLKQAAAATAATQAFFESAPEAML